MCKNKRVYLLRGRWTITEIEKKKCKNKWADALKGRWTVIGFGLVWFGLCCLMTSGLSKDIRCHV